MLLMNKARLRTLPPDIYVEKHHFVPLSLGGNKDDIVRLTAREHFIAHLLLIKMTSDSDKAKMAHALWMMCAFKKGHNANRYKPPSRLFATARKLKAEATSASHKNKIISKEHRALLSSLKKGVKGTPHTEEAKQKMTAHHTGGGNPSAKMCKFMGNTYTCIKEAARQNNTTPWFVKKHLSFEII